MCVCVREVVWIELLPALVVTLAAPSFLFFYFLTFLSFSLVPVDSAHSCAKWLLRHDMVGVDPDEESKPREPRERGKVYRA